jgi:GLPGLI family protein
MDHRLCTIVPVKEITIRIKYSVFRSKPLFLVLKATFMKHLLFLALLAGASSVQAQTPAVKQAIIYTTTTVVAPEEEDVANIQTQGAPQGAMMFRNFGDGETKSVTYVKDDQMKTVIKTDMGRSTIIRNNTTKMTTTLMEMMGNRTGFYASDDDMAQMRKRMDSMMQSRPRDSGTTVRAPQAPAPIEISYTEDTKKIAGYNCKKVYVIATRLLGLKDTSVAWYTPELKIDNLNSTGGSGMASMFTGNAGNGLGGLSKIDGFVMQYETKMRRGRVMTVQVTKVETNKDIAAKEFEVPKDFDLKPMKEMQNMMGGGGQGNFQIRRGN